jgi:16S rRNA (uracil1498-N3)-methyltransferase
LFNGQASTDGQFGEYAATVTHMGRSSVQVQVGDWAATHREAIRQVHLAVGMPANDRMDWLVEKAAELGVASIQPLMTERSVLRLSGDRASKKQAHWQSVAVAACEQCGGNRVPLVHELLTLAQWLKARSAQPDAPTLALLLTLRVDSKALREAALPNGSGGAVAPGITFLSGPEGGLSPTEEDAALACGFKPVTLGPRVLRSETAALVALTGLLVS